MWSGEIPRVGQSGGFGGTSPLVWGAGAGMNLPSRALLSAQIQADNALGKRV